MMRGRMWKMRRMEMMKITRIRIREEIYIVKVHELITETISAS